MASSELLRAAGKANTNQEGETENADMRAEACQAMLANIQMILDELYEINDTTSESWLKKIVHYEALATALQSKQKIGVDVIAMTLFCRFKSPTKWELDSYDFNGPMTGRCEYKSGSMKGCVFSVEEGGVYLRNGGDIDIRFGDKPTYRR